MSKEIWKPLIYKGVDYTGHYEVSNKANVNSLERTVLDKNGCKRFVSSKILKPCIQNGGYYGITISKNGIRRTIKLSVAVATVFIPNPENKRDVNHKDCNKENNLPNNLEWTTHKENTAHAFKNGLYKNLQGENCNLAKLTEKDVKQIRQKIKRGQPLEKLSKSYKVHRDTIRLISKNITWKHIL